jgi:hypothetical protein
MIHRLRKKRKKFEFKILPFTISAMLEYLSIKAREEQFRDAIEECSLDFDKVQKALANYIELFESMNDKVMGESFIS